MALDFAAGCIGGTAGILLGYPFDTVKVMMQTQSTAAGAAAQYTGTLQCIRSIVARQSVAGLYRGLSSPLGGVALVNAVVFGVYGNVQKRSAHPDSLRTHCFAGTLAGLTQSVITSPMELTKTLLQMQSSSASGGGGAGSCAAGGAPHQQRPYSGAVDCARRIYRSEGGRGLYRGFSITAARDVPGFASYFVLYELLVRAGQPAGGCAGAAQTLLAGGLAGVGSWILTMPMDVVKTRLQTDGVGGAAPKYAGMWDCARRSYAAEGWRFATRGMSSTLLRAFLMNSVCFYVVGAVMAVGEAGGAAERTSAAIGLPAEPHALRQMLAVDGGLSYDDRLSHRYASTEKESPTSSSPAWRRSSAWSLVSDAMVDVEDLAEWQLELDGGRPAGEDVVVGYFNVTGKLMDTYDHRRGGEATAEASELLRIHSE